MFTHRLNISHLTQPHKKVICIGTESNSLILTYLTPFLIAQFYYEYDNADISPVGNDTMPEATRQRFFTPNGYFWSNYVHPRAWRKVLEKYPTLRLCLAHFGGDDWKTYGLDSDWIKEIISIITEKNDSQEYKYPNVFTDVACWDISNNKVNKALKHLLKTKIYSRLKQRILFGTDWYLSMVTGPVCTYTDYCRNWKNFLDQIDDSFDFFSLFDEDNIDKIQYALQTNGVDSQLCQDNYMKVKNLKSEYDNLKKAL